MFNLSKEAATMTPYDPPVQTATAARDEVGRMAHAAPRADGSATPQESDTRPKPMKQARIVLYGNFGAGNLGNEITLQTVIAHIRRHRPDAQLQCFCTGPGDVQSRHHIPAVAATVAPSTRALALDTSSGIPESPEPLRKAAAPAQSRGPIAQIGRLLRLVFQRLPLEVLHGVKILNALRRSDMLIIAGTGIVADYMCGPTGWPYDMFKLSTLAVLCRVKVVFLSVGVGPINHPLSRWLIKTSLGHASYRSYRDEASRAYLEEIGFRTDHDGVYPDVVFGFPRHLLAAERAPERQRQIVGLGLKDYSGVMGDLETEEYRAYLNSMANFVAWLHAHDFGVRLLIGDFSYDTLVREDLVRLLKSRNVCVDPPLLICEPAFSVGELLRQLADTDLVLSPRYHNLVMALIQNKPVMALSDHPKLDSLLTELGLRRYIMRLEKIESGALIELFQELHGEMDRLKPLLRREIEEYCEALEEQYTALLAEFRPSTATLQPEGGIRRSGT
jgi:polysaccharide pyruvyl transferase WcaK-like protein